MASTKCPYQDRSLRNIKGEQWKDIPGLEGYFRISNVGRIKRLKRESVNSRGTVVIYKEQIIAPRLMFASNHHTADTTAQLFAHLQVEGRRYHLPIRRLVFHCFVQPFDLKDKTITIICKNKNGLDMRASNLKMLTLGESARRIIRLNRRPPAFKNFDHQKAAMASAKVTAKQISRYDLKGRRLSTYPSTMEASRQTGISHGYIANAAAGRERTAGGAFWSFGNAPRFDVSSFLEKRRKGHQEKGSKVSQYDLSGHRIAQYSSLKEAAAALGVHYSGISANLRGITRTAYGCLWRRGWGRERIKV